MSKIAGIYWDDTAAAPGISLSVYFSGCHFHCPGCHNPEAQDFNYGEEYGVDIRQEIMQKLNSLPFTKKDARSFTRFLTSGATILEFDKQGRILLPSYLTEYASVLKEIVIVGVINRIELWSRENWEKFMNDNFDHLSDISENLFDSSLNI